MRFSGMLLVASLLLVLSGPLQAAELRTVEIGFFGGFYFGDSAAAVDDDLIYGARAAVNLTPVHQLELVYDRVDTAFASPSFGRLDETFQSYTLAWVFNFPLPSGPLVPYGFVGLGRIDDRVELPGGGASEDDDLFVPFGGGLRVFAGDNMAFRFEARYKSYSTFDVRQGSFELTAGLGWALGRRR